MTKKFMCVLELFVFLALLFCACLFVFDDRYAYATLDGIALWIGSILPTLLPYFFITSMLSTLKITGKISNLLSPITKPLFNVSGSVGYAFFLSILSGYPVGAKTISDLKLNGVIGESESVRGAILCSTSSPVFLIGCVGNIMFKNSLFGVLLLFSHLITVLIVGFIFSFYKKSDKPKNTNTAFSPTRIDNVLYETAFDSVISVLVVGALITVFYLLTEILLNLNLLSPLINFFTLIVKDENIAKSFVLGAFECTKGLSTLSSSASGFFALPIACALCSFGGVSVICQSLAYLKKAKIKTAPFIISKIISAVVGFIIALLFSAIFL